VYLVLVVTLYAVIHWCVGSQRVLGVSGDPVHHSHTLVCRRSTCTWC